MPSIKKVTESFSVSDQIVPSDLAMIAKQGFKTIVVNRPDNEAHGQPNFVEIERDAQKLGLRAIYLPVFLGQSVDSAAREFERILPNVPSPILAYCRSGNRSLTLWKQTAGS